MTIPSLDVSIVVLTNAAPIGIAETVSAEFTDLVQFGEVRQDWRAIYKNAFEGMDEPMGELVGKTPPADPVPRNNSLPTPGCIRTRSGVLRRSPTTTAP